MQYWTKFKRKTKAVGKWILILSIFILFVNEKASTLRHASPAKPSITAAKQGKPHSSSETMIRRSKKKQYKANQYETPTKSQHSETLHFDNEILLQEHFTPPIKLWATPLQLCRQGLSVLVLERFVVKDICDMTNKHIPERDP